LIAITGKLQGIATKKFKRVVTDLSEKIGRLDPKFWLGTGTLGGPPTKSRRARLDVGVTIPTQLAIFHGVGAAFGGLLVAVAYFRELWRISENE
jgi:hypothetical protein